MRGPAPKIFVLLLLWIGSGAVIQVSLHAGENSLLDTDARFKAAFERTTHRLKEVSIEKPFRNSAMNESLKLSAEAAERILNYGNSEEALTLIKKAQSAYQGNNFSILLQALITDRENKSKSFEFYLNYLHESIRPTKFDTCFLDHLNYHEMRRGILLHLDRSNISIQHHSKQLSSGFDLRRYLRSKWTLTILAVALSFFFLNFYFSILRFVKQAWERFGPAPSGFHRCPHCRQISSKIILECFHCHFRF